MRFVTVLLSATLLLVALVGPAAAKGKPDRAPYVPEVIAYPADLYCGFDVLLADNFAKGMGHFTDTRFVFAGTYKGTVTSRHGTTFYYRLAGNVKVTFRADGSLAQVVANGTFMSWYEPGDPAAVAFGGPGIYLHTGRLVERYAPNGALISAISTGPRTTDICAALAPQD
ncbi:MAG TPA: hypothetical protein VM305_05635 [Candidatus Limnocylindrales bacterium]|nr:hypothetical protein [Candidatus Limnocylindrales bacterium]